MFPLPGIWQILNNCKYVEKIQLMSGESPILLGLYIFNSLEFTTANSERHSVQLHGKDSEKYYTAR